MRRFLVLGLLLAAAVTPVTVFADTESVREALDCRVCHECPNPTAAEPGLKHQQCPRHELSSTLKPGMGPDVAILDQLEDLYVPVRFDHKAHAGMVGMNNGCETCHHFTPPNNAHPACRECHPASIQHEDLTQPGLKGAYHRQCMGCHAEWDHDTKCEICHEKKAGGRLHGSATTFTHDRHYDVIEMKELIIFDTEYEEGDQVPFHHRNHSVKYELNCALCHVEQSCSQCHVNGSDSHPMGSIDEVDMHDTCYMCHADNDCDACHGRDPDDLFDHASTGWPLKPQHAQLHCRTCHGSTGTYNKPDPACDSCHAGGWDQDTFDHAVTGVVLGEIHGDADCSDCHTGGVGAVPACDNCHDDQRSYDRGSGFGE